MPENRVLLSANLFGGISKNRKTIPTDPIQTPTKTRVMFSYFNDPPEYKTVSRVNKPMGVISTELFSFFSFPSIQHP